MARVAVATLGCKVNQVESEQMKEDFLRMGYQLVDFTQEADVYVINTCTVTHVSDSKSRALIRRAHRRNPRALIVAAGCLAQVDSQQVADIEGVAVVLGNRDKEQVAQLVDRFMACPPPTVVQKVTAFDHTNTISPVLFSQPHERTRAFIKIEDGCNAHCTYCIVPKARGPVCSKEPEYVLHEVAHLVSLGYREIVFTGIHTGAYGQDLDGWDLVKLLETALGRISGECRLRISSLEPLEVSDRLVELLKNRPGLCRHLHIPLQSGCDRVLQRMNRGYDRDYYRNRLVELTGSIAGMAITTDVMVGFPGETASDFEETRCFLQELPISGMHVFKYSRRPGTPAADYPEQVAEHDKQERSHQLLILAREKEQTFAGSQVGQSLSVLVEKELKPGRYVGMSDNYLNLEFASSHDLRGQLVMLQVTAVGRGQLFSPGS
ncbi:MAG TPA: tRNA (N(6)-L-threonylcarbamoyladenosine(37)-C(2))-methylthiotransferase MtaB [Syntrophomonadaceae bacterium]|nr:tRNA (N(6)-L-threonylcarbamoyladenosine(37)-C(2))-methylthiotransferase MtaB [Syntrophomonadaceae bacterium]